LADFSTIGGFGSSDFHSKRLRLDFGQQEAEIVSLRNAPEIGASVAARINLGKHFPDIRIV
jgi:hypothetical protein